MIKLLHTESSMNLGGQELRILAEIEGLSGMGYESSLVARPGARILDEALIRGMKAYPVSMRGSIDPAAVMSIAGIMRREKTDIVNSHGSKDGWSAGVAARLTGVKVVRSRHVANPIRAHYFGRLVYGPLCDVIVTTSESIRNGMAARGVDPGKMVSVPTGIDAGRFDPDMPKGGFRSELGVDCGTRLVGMVSVLRGDKGPDVFIKAAKKVCSEIPDVVFVLVGDGWMMEALEKMAADSEYSARIRLTGYRRDIPEVMAGLDVFVLPARIPEGVPQAVLQAHMMKVPVIASDVGGINEVAIPGRTALCVPPGDAEALAGAVTKILSDRDMSARLADAGHALVMERYTLDGMMKRMDGIYRGLLHGGRA